MNKWEKNIEKATTDCMPWKAEIIRLAKIYIETEHVVRMNPLGLSAYHGPESDPKWAEYYRARKEHTKAYADLLVATDVEYGDDDIACAAWEWKYWLVMARKCCWYQKSILTDHMAAKTMRNLQDAETKFMDACGLLEMYKPSSHYLEHHFPNLKLDK